MIRKLKYYCVLLFTIVIMLGIPTKTFAISLESDPQYIVINFADFYFLDWDAPKEKWQREVKPKALAELKKWRAILGRGNGERVLAWSTLLEYMNFPADTPSKSSPYVLQARRIMELARAADFPVFMPLNGVQWWDEQPELWNYWDHDGNQTPQCTNADFASCPYERLRNPEYRKRFIKGYNKNNKYNVDWKDWENPMGFSIRNWGGPDVWVAPSPNLAAHSRTKKTFRSVQTERYETIVQEISVQLKKWEAKGKSDLFAGIAIGTEVTLNGAVVPGDANFKPFGYRALQDTFCAGNNPTCGKNKNWTSSELHAMRQHVLFLYFNDFARRANMHGVPKQRIYTHVWSEAEPGETKYTDALLASYTYYSRPGLSLYGKATNPFGFSVLTNMLKRTGYSPWAAPEFSPLTRDAQNWNQALESTLQNENSPARVIDIYNERDIAGGPAMAELKSILMAAPLKESCSISEIVPTTKNKAINPTTISWKYLLDIDDAKNMSLLLWHNSFPGKPYESSKQIKKVPIALNKTSYSIGTKARRGFYYWSLQRTGCNNTKWRTSEPRLFIIETPVKDSTFGQKLVHFINTVLN